MAGPGPSAPPSCTCARYGALSETGGGRYRLRLSDGDVLTARTVIIATGVSYGGWASRPWRTCRAGGSSTVPRPQ